MDKIKNYFYHRQWVASKKALISCRGKSWEKAPVLVVKKVSVVIHGRFFMPKTKDQKKEELEKLKENLKEMKAMVFVNHDKLTVNEVNELRGILREEKVNYFIAKKTLLKKALKENGMDVNIDELTGGLGLAFGLQDEIAPAKLLHTFSKKHEALKLIGGIFEDSFIDKERVLSLALLPSREELLYKTVYLIKSPVTGFVNFLRGNLNNLVYVLKAITEKAS